MDNHLNIIVIDSDLHRRDYIFSILRSSRKNNTILPDQSPPPDKPGYPTIIMLGDQEDLAIELNKLNPISHGIPIVVHSLEVNARRIVHALTHGATDYVIPTGAQGELEEVLLRSAAKSRENLKLGLREIPSQVRLSQLTKREREVLLCIAKGYSNRATGHELSISPRTVEIHRANMMNKLGFKNSTEAVRFAIKSGFA